MSFMNDRNHIAITSGDTSTTRCKVLHRAATNARPTDITQGKFSGTYSRIAAVRGNMPRTGPPNVSGAQSSTSNSATCATRCAPA